MIETVWIVAFSVRSPLESSGRSAKPLRQYPGKIEQQAVRQRRMMLRHRLECGERKQKQLSIRFCDHVGRSRTPIEKSQLTDY